MKLGLLFWELVWEFVSLGIVLLLLLEMSSLILGYAGTIVEIADLCPA